MKEGAGGWTSPQVIVAAIGILSVTAGSYLAIQRDDSERIRAELADHSRRLAILETRLEYIAETGRHERTE